MGKRQIEDVHNSLGKEPEIKKLGPPKCSLLLDEGLLYRTQGVSEFRGQTLANVRQAYLTNKNFLQDAKLACCAYPLNSEHISDVLIEEAPYILPLMDGHHRLKVGREEFNVVDFPVEVFSILQAQRFYHDINVNNTMAKLFEWAMAATTIQRRNQLIIVRFSGNQFKIGM